LQWSSKSNFFPYKVKKIKMFSQSRFFQAATNFKIHYYDSLKGSCEKLSGLRNPVAAAAAAVAATAAIVYYK